MSEILSWHDGELTTHPVIDASDRGFLVGHGIFETLLVQQAHVEFLDRHLERLIGSWTRIGLGALDGVEITQAVSQVIESNPQATTLARLRITVTLNNNRPSVLVTIAPMTKWPTTTSCVVVPWTLSDFSPLTGIKSTSYAANILGMQWAQAQGFSEGLFVNARGEIVEGTASNIFLVLDGEVVTPASSSGPLPGIIRGLLLESGQVQEAVLSPEDLERASEIFVTSSTRGIHPVDRCGDRVVSSIGSKTLEASRYLSELRVLDRQ